MLVPLTPVASHSRHEPARRISTLASDGCIRIFDQRIGDVFCARVAGNFVNTDIIGSLEYSTQVAGAKAIVVLGHNFCGAINSAVDERAGADELGSITALLKNFRPAPATL